MNSGSSFDDEDESATFADVFNAFTLDSGRKRRKRRGEEPPPDEEPGDQPDGGVPQSLRPPQPPPARGAYNGHDGYDSRNGYDGYDQYRARDRYGAYEGDWADERAVPRQPAGEDTGFVRPYALTGGRTKANHVLELETLISTREGAHAGVPAQFEHQQIMEECRAPRSVAEIAATLGVPLGVARVLISDAADAGLINVHRTVSPGEGAEAHFMLMERVLSGLRRL